MQSGSFIQGDQVAAFESEFGRFLGGVPVVAVANGTDALELCMEVLNMNPGDEVIVPALTWISPALAVYKSGLVPVFVDVRKSDGTLDAEAVQAAITVHTKAVLAVHLGGNPAQMDTLARVCQAHNLVLIEDCAQAIGATLNGQPVGTFGDLAIFSFYPTKNLGALGDAGCIVGKSPELMERLRSLRDYGRSDRNHFELAGRNSRMDELQAAFLRTKLPYIQNWNARRMAIAARYHEAVGERKQVEGAVYYRFWSRRRDRANFLEELTEAGIGYDLLDSNLMEAVPFFKKYQRAENPVARQLASEIVCLPMYPELTDTEVDYICQFLVSHNP